MKEAELYPGTSSWTADGWAGSFYPTGSKPADFLHHYAGQFNSVEIYSTFYRIPAAKTVGQWRDRTPSGFVFETAPGRAAGDLDARPDSGVNRSADAGTGSEVPGHHRG